jgi:hypothetical protein
MKYGWSNIGRKNLQKDDALQYFLEFGMPWIFVHSLGSFNRNDTFNASKSWLISIKLIYIAYDAVCTLFLAHMVDILWSLKTVDLVHIRD